MHLTKAGTPPQVFLGRYEAVRLLDEGGMGRVYLGRQLDGGRPVVIKVLRDELADDPRVRQGFAREMRLMTRFRHPHAVALYEAGQDDHSPPCIVMEHIV